MKDKLNLIQSKIIPVSGLILSGYILYLSIIDKLSFYIHPDYKIFATGMGIILFLISLYGIFFYKSHTHNLKFYQILPIVLLTLFIFILGILIPPTSLTSNTALRRGMDDNNISFSRSSDDGLTFSSFGKDSRTFDIATWLKAFSIDPEPSEYIGKKVVVTGFFHQPNDLDKKLFYVSRYVITCCSVDARPVGLLVDNIDMNLKESEWVQVTGEFAVTKLNNKDVTVIRPSEIKKVETPNNPYVF